MYIDDLEDRTDVYDVLQDMIEDIVWISLEGGHVFDVTGNLHKQFGHSFLLCCLVPDECIVAG